MQRAGRLLVWHGVRERPVGLPIRRGLQVCPTRTAEPQPKARSQECARCTQECVRHDAEHRIGAGGEDQV